MQRRGVDQATGQCCIQQSVGSVLECGNTARGGQGVEIGILKGALATSMVSSLGGKKEDVAAP